VPALVIELGDRVWWPSALWRSRRVEDAPTRGEPAPAGARDGR
jgi:hypothetical protein